jgi:hypothetical protein
VNPLDVHPVTDVTDGEVLVHYVPARDRWASVVAHQIFPEESVDRERQKEEPTSASSLGRGWKCRLLFQIAEVPQYSVSGIGWLLNLDPACHGAP